MSKPNEYDTYIIPPNFIEGGTFFGGLLKLRNTAEALVIVLAIGIPVFSVSALTLTAKIIILCLTALPLGIIALVGINGESLSSFIFLVLKYLHNRRVITRNEEEQGMRKKRKKHKAKSGDDAPKYINPVAEYLPVEKIENGIIYTRDHRYLKIVEVIPINFLLRSAREQRNIIYSFISFLKISPVKMQIKVIAKRADLNRHREIVQQEMAQETDENCRLLQQDYLTLIDRIGAREATSRRFFMVFEYEAWAGRKRDNEEAEAIASLQTAARTAVNYLKQCGNEVLIPENDDEFTVDTLYHLLCRNTTTSLPDRVRRIVAQYQEKGLESEIDAIPCTEFFAPDSIDFTNGRHICIDGLYYAYLLVPSTGYKAQVPAGWLSLIVNAGDGIDLDMFISRQPKARMVQRLGQQLRINRSKIKDASDTNTDFDDLDGAIRSGYFLKEGLGNNEDFYYLNLLIAVTAPTVDELEWKVNELKKLLVSRDMDVCSCAFHEEQAFLSSLPLVSMEKHLFERSKRNALTTGVASCYPFTSYELSDENGILFGLNKYNNSPVIIDIFDSKVYKNANNLRALALHYEDVVDQMFIQLDGLSFVERAFQELRTKCHKAAYWSNSNAGYDRKGDTLRFGGYFCSCDERWGHEEWRLAERMQDIFTAVAHYETNTFGRFPAGFSELLGYSDVSTSQFQFPTCQKLVHLRMFKNGRVDLKFKTAALAKEFAETYLDYSC